MTETAQPLQFEPSLLRRLLTDLDACRAGTDNRPPEAREGALRDMENCLASMRPLAEDDVFALMGRLKDDGLAPATRERIADNLARAAPFTAARNLRVQEWIAARENSVSNSRREQKAAESCLNKAIALLHVAQAAVGAAGAMGGSDLASGLGYVLGDAINELATATIMLSFADSMLDEPLPLLPDLLARDQAEAQLFTEVQEATIQ